MTQSLREECFAQVTSDRRANPNYPLERLNLIGLLMYATKVTHSPDGVPLSDNLPSVPSKT